MDRCRHIEGLCFGTAERAAQPPGIFDTVRVETVDVETESVHCKVQMLRNVNMNRAFNKAVE